MNVKNNLDMYDKYTKYKKQFTRGVARRRRSGGHVASRVVVRQTGKNGVIRERVDYVFRYGY